MQDTQTIALALKKIEDSYPDATAAQKNDTWSDGICEELARLPSDLIVSVANDVVKKYSTLPNAARVRKFVDMALKKVPALPPPPVKFGHESLDETWAQVITNFDPDRVRHWLYCIGLADINDGTAYLAIDSRVIRNDTGNLDATIKVHERYVNQNLKGLILAEIAKIDGNVHAVAWAAETAGDDIPY